MDVTILGIRHHGVGSEIQVGKRLEELSPDHIIIEVPTELSEIIDATDLRELTPPVAILSYAESAYATSAFYPFASFSPEWQAMCYAQDNGITLTCADLPLKHDFARPNMCDNDEETPDEKEYGYVKEMDEIAKLSGFENYESWWDTMFESHCVESAEAHFQAVEEVMCAVRERYPKNDDLDNLREAFMREAIRKALRNKKEKIVFICGAWHVTALLEYKSQSKSDKAVMKNLNKTKVSSTWVPWTNRRLSWFSGYGAGISSAG